MAFVKTEYIERMEFEDGDHAYCRPCDASQPMQAVSKSKVACQVCGTEQHAANLVVNGSLRR